MLLIALRKGGAKCSSACPFYAESGVVRGINGPLKTHCRMTMNPWMADCDVYDPNNIHKVEVTEEEFKTMLKAVHKRAKKERKPYPDDHKEIHPVGWSWTHDRFRTGASQSCSDKWRAGKSASVKPCRDTAIPGFRGSVKH